MCAPLFLDEGAGKLMIFPQGSELHLQPSSETFGVWGARPRRRRQFWGHARICPGILHSARDTIFVLGALSWEPGLGNPAGKGAKSDTIAASGELSRIRPGFVSEGEADLLRREADSLPGTGTSFGSGSGFGGGVLTDILR